MKKLLAIVMCVAIMLSLSVTAFAAKSPVGEVYYEILLRAGEGVEGIDKEGVPVKIKEGDKVVVKIDEDLGKFDNWIIYLDDAKNTVAKEGVHYEIAEGKLDGSPISIIPKADLIICGNYNGKITDPATGEFRDPTAPPTGPFEGVGMYIVIGVCLLTAIVAFLVFGTRRKKVTQQ